MLRHVHIIKTEGYVKILNVVRFKKVLIELILRPLVHNTCRPRNFSDEGVWFVFRRQEGCEGISWLSKMESLVTTSLSRFFDTLHGRGEQDPTAE